MVKRAFLHLYYKANRTFEEVKALGRGLERHGWEVYAGDHKAFTGADLVLQWNIRNGELVNKVLDAGGESCILETSYIEPRREYCSLGFGYGINNRLRHYGPFEDASRWNRLFKDRMKPWREPQTGPVLIMGQTPGDMALQRYVNFWDWVARTYNDLTEAGYDVRLRPHPNTSPHMIKRRGMRMKKWQRNVVHADEDRLYRGLHKVLEDGIAIETGKTLEQALDEAAFTYTFNSNSGVDSVLHGTPAVAVDAGAMAYDVTSRHWNDIVRPDREAWAHALAWKQWTRGELESGEAWAHVCPPHLS